MKKVILAVVLVLVIVVAGIPMLAGIIMEKNFRNSVQHINQICSDAGGDLSIEIINYDKNFTSSQMDLKLNSKIINALYGFDDIVLVYRAEHGYTKTVFYTSLEKNKWFSDFLNNKLNGNNPLTIKTVYDYFGQSKTKITVDEFSLKVKKDTIEFKPAQLDIDFQKGMKHLLLKGTNLTIKKIKGQGKESNFALSNLTCDYTMGYDETENTASFEIKYGLDSIIAGKNSVKDAFVKIAVNEIDINGYKEYMKLSSEMGSKMAKDLSQDTSKSPQQKQTYMAQQMAKMQGLTQAYEKILKKDLEFKVSDLKATVKEGQIKGNITLTLKQDIVFAKLTPIKKQPSLALDFFSLKSDFNIPYELIGEKGQMLLNPIYPGMKTGLFLKEGNLLTHNAETRDGKLFINDHELVLQ